MRVSRWVVLLHIAMLTAFVFGQSHAVSQATTSTADSEQYGLPDDGKVIVASRPGSRFDHAAAMPVQGGQSNATPSGSSPQCHRRASPVACSRPSGHVELSSPEDCASFTKPTRTFRAGVPILM
jgi:hypothetical protein